MTTAKSLVYVVNNVGRDYSAAKRWGELVFCTTGILPKYDLVEMYRRLSESMIESVDTDYLLLTSLNSLCCVASAILAYKHGCVNFLIYKGDGYVERKVVLKRTTNNANSERRR